MRRYIDIAHFEALPQLARIRIPSPLYGLQTQLSRNQFVPHFRVDGQPIACIVTHSLFEETQVINNQGMWKSTAAKSPKEKSSKAILHPPENHISVVIA
jgi:hypothetical protein